MKILGFDCETSGVDLNFTSRPFYLSIANDKDVTAWSWKIDPLTRNLTVPEGDIAEIAAYLDTADILVAHHAKFDIRALHTAGLEWRWWDKTHDTLFSGHLLASGERHDLTTQCLRFLNYDIQPFENDLDTICQEARRIARRDYPNWRIATKGNKDMPSADEQLWKWDMWLPAAVAEAEGWAADHPWRTVLAKYNHIDSSVLIPLWKKHQALMGERKLTPLYNERLKLIRIIYEMEERGVTYNFTKMDQLHAQFQAESQEDEQVCLALAAGELDALPKGGRSKALEKLLFETWKLPVNKVSKKTQTPSMDKEVLGKWAATLPEGSVSHQFITRLHSKRQRDTAAAYIAGYKRYSTKASIGMRKLHPGMNPTGTATLRFSMQNPNSANISKQGYANLRRAFGPAYGLEWWACDYENIELRIPAYEADETEMVALFERPNDPPYFGSVHFLMFDTLHPELYAKHGIEVKKLFADTWYQWTKNGDFAAQYQSGDETADRAYHVPGALRRIKSRFSKIDELNQRCVKFANKHGYIETLIDREFGVGYPLQVERQWGRAKPTLPLNYRVQGCLAGDSRVLTDKGLIPIRETVGQKVKVWTGFKWAEAVGLDRGKCRRAVVTLDSGLKVRCDTRHKLKNEMDEWVDFEKIKVGNYVALPRNPDPLSPSKEINWWFILGFIIGDGSLCRRGNRRTLTISGWVTKKPILEAIKLFLDKNAHQGDAYGRQGFGLTRFRTRRVGRLYEVSLENAKFADLLEGFGINFDWRFNTKRVPESVWRASLQDQRDFLEGLWLSDGSRSVKRGSGHQLNMVNPKLLQEVQILCSALGFDAHFTGSQLRFRWRGFGAKSSRDYPSNAVLRQVKSVERSKYPEKNESITDQRAFKQALSGKPISQYVAERILERNARNPVIYRYDRITSIEVLDTEESTYTMSVDDPLHQFVADGVVHKNTAMWCMCRAMIRCQAYLADLSGCAMVLQVHDELVFQLPKGETPQANLPTVLKLKELMECSGQDIGIPLPVKCSYHPNNWAESVPYSTTVGF